MSYRVVMSRAISSYAGGVSLLEQSPWWLVPFGVLALAMVHAMMEFTVSLLAEAPKPRRRPLAADELRRRLLAANRPDFPDRLVKGEDCDLEIRWRQENAPPPGRRAAGRAASEGRLRLLLDERRRELRLNQVGRSYVYLFGLSGWLPRLRGYAGFHSGPPGHPMAAELGRIATRAGWSVRPVIWWFQATRRGQRRLEALTPPPLRRWPARRLWGLLYPLSFVLAMGYLVLIAGPLDRRNVLLLAAVSAAWWGVWGFLAWMLRGFPAFRRRRNR